MAGTTHPPGFGDLFGMFGSNNPLGALAKSVDQFRTGVTGFLEAVSTFKQTMESLNTVTTRMNRLLDDIEGPLRTLMPQLTIATEEASRVFTMLSGPVERVGPGLVQLAETLTSPAMVELPRRLGDAIDVLATLPRTLDPLTQMAEMAGGLFGMRGLTRPAPTPAPSVADRSAPATAPAATKRTASKRAATKKSSKPAKPAKSPGRPAASPKSQER